MTISRLIYFGTAPIAVPALIALHELSGVEVLAVCTQPDRPSGRKRKLTPSAVKVCALERAIPVIDPEKISEAREQLTELKPDLGVVFAYGQYLPTSIFDLPIHGSINFHPSLLPKFRGASPIQSSLLAGLIESGLSVIKVGKKMDAGDVLMQRPLHIDQEDTSEILHDRFGKLAAELVPELWEGLSTNALTSIPQNEEDATQCGKISKQDGEIQWLENAITIFNRIRAYQPWPGAYFPLGDKGNVKILKAKIEAGKGMPGTILSIQGEGPLVACGDGALRLVAVQPPGKKPMDGKSFLNGHPLEVGWLLADAIHE